MTATALVIRRPDSPLARALAIFAGAGWGVAVMGGGLDSPTGQVIAFLFLLPLSICALMAGPRPGQSGHGARVVLWPLLLFAGGVWAALMSWPSLSPDAMAPDFFLPALLGQLSVGMALFLGIWLGDRRDGRTLELMLILTGYAALIAALLLRMIGPEMGDGIGDAMRHGRFVGTVANANMACALFGTCALLALGRAIEYGRPAATAAFLPGFGFWLAFFALSGGSLLTASRVGNLMLLVGIAIQLGHMGRIGHVLRRQYVQAMLLLGVLGLLAIICAPLLWMRAEISPVGLLERGTLWTHYAGAAMDAPLTGHGLGAFARFNARHLVDVDLIQTLWMVNSPHNFLIGLVIAGGLPTLAMTLAAIILMARPMVGAAVHGAWRARETGLATGLALLMGEGLVDIGFDFPITALTTALLAGLLWSRSRSGAVRIRRSGHVPAR